MRIGLLGALGVVAVLSCERTPSAPPEQPAPAPVAAANEADELPAVEPNKDPGPPCPDGMVLLEPGDTPEELVPFCLGALEVTVAEYRACVEAGVCNPPDPDLQWRVEMTWLSENPRLPINHIHYEDALAYCRFSGGRLPTEAEWAWAAGPGRGQNYPWGDTFTLQPPEVYCGLYLRPGAEGLAATPCVGGQNSIDRTEHGIYDLVGSLDEYLAENAEGKYGVATMSTYGGVLTPEDAARETGTISGGKVRVHRDDKRQPLVVGDYGVRCARDRS
ncbi:MAG: SUMF1/EgtB/PvdO family nonheme iron enzyme [Myxococcota bacterium]